MLDELEIKEPLPSYSPTLYRITGGKGEAVALAQLIYKCSKSNWGTVRMSSTDWENEIQLSRREFDNLNNCIVALELGSIELVNIGPIKKMAYTLSKDAIYNALKDTGVTYGRRKKFDVQVKEISGAGNKSVTWTGNKVRVQVKEDAHIKDNKTIKSKEDTKEPLNETSSFGAFGLKTDLLKEVMAENIERGEAAKTKSKKPKEATDELTAEIHKYTLEAHDFFKAWYEDRYQTTYAAWDKDFVNIKRIFRKLISGSASLDETKRLTPERCFKGVQYILENFDKLKEFDQNRISLNHIATNWSSLIARIKDFKPPVAKQNFNEPVPFVPAVKEKIEYFNTMPLPVGLSEDNFRNLGEAIYREKIMDGVVNERELSVTQFTEIIYKQIKPMTTDQINNLLTTYGII